MQERLLENCRPFTPEIGIFLPHVVLGIFVLGKCRTMNRGVDTLLALLRGMEQYYSSPEYPSLS